MTDTQPTTDITTELALTKKLYENYSMAIDNAIRNGDAESSFHILRDAQQQDRLIRKIGLAK
jgi:hypothetical protein